MRALCFVVILFSYLGYAQKINHTKLSFKKDLIPEGIAVDTVSKKIYLNSLRNNKIVRCNFDGSNTEDFISVNQYGYLPGFGMTIKGDTLFALGNSLARPDNSSILLLLNINSGKLIKSYSPNNSNFIYLNDIAIGPNGKCYITDSENENIYTINSKKDTLEVFFSHPEIKHSNGIAISPDGNLLYLATYTSGLRILDINSKKLVNAPNDFKGIDGMKFYKNSLLTIINARRDADQNGLFQFYLDKSNSKIIKQEKLDNFQNATEIPTTFALYNDQMFFVSDSQLDNLNQETNEILNPLELKDYILIKQPINSKPFKNQNP